MAVARVNVWVSDVADACGTWGAGGRLTVFDCTGILEWPCGRYRAADDTWKAVPGGKYKDLPVRCGHVEFEVPPGCYWAVAGYVSPGRTWIHLNYATHVGIVQARCDETACVKLYNPTLKLCWNWFLIGIQMHTVARSQPALPPDKVKQLADLGNELLRGVPTHPIEPVVERVFHDLFEAARKGEETQDKP